MSYKIKIERRVILRNGTKDFGLGVGCIYKDVLKIKARTKGLAVAGALSENQKLLSELVDIEMEVVK